MVRTTLAALTPIVAVLVLAAAAHQPAPVGAPWLSLELPANPMDQSTEGAAFVVHAYMHGNPARFPVAGRAEGIVDGRRQSVELQFSETSRPGVYAVDQVWPAKGHWVLAVNLNIQGGSGLLVELGPNGGVHSADYYGMDTKVLSLSSVRVIQGKIDSSKIDRVLQTMALRSGD